MPKKRNGKTVSMVELILLAAAVDVVVAAAEDVSDRCGVQIHSTP
jgi:hypothetical protein